jgi:hypothetical protein
LLEVCCCYRALAGRIVPLNATLRDALIALKAKRNGVEPGDRIIHSERDIGMSPGVAVARKYSWAEKVYSETAGTFREIGIGGRRGEAGRQSRRGRGWVRRSAAARCRLFPQKRV